MESRYKRLTWTLWRSGFAAEEIILPSMNIDNDNMEGATDFGLTLGYSSEFIQRALNIESGAGVNAGLRINIPFVASSPLSELVWSPHKGLGIKCAESTFMDRKPPILLDAGQTNKVLSPKANSNDNPVDATLLTQRAAMNVCGESSHKHCRGTGGYGDRTNTVEVSLQLLPTNQEEDHLRDVEAKGVCGLVDVQTVELSNTKDEKTRSLLDLMKGAVTDVISNQPDEVKADVLPSFGSTIGGIDGSGDQTLGREIVLASHLRPMNECEASNFPTADTVSSPGRKRCAEQAPDVAVEGKSKMKKTGLEKPESTNENDFLSLTSKDASKVAPSESTHELQLDCQKNEGALPMDSEVGGRRRKGKEKALSDGDVHEDDDSSHGSVESCNSAQLFPTGKKRWSFEQLLVQSKRAKNETKESPCSTSFVKKDSSFMNWISNMVQGFGKPVEDKEYSTSPTLPQPPHEDEHTSQKLVLHEKTQDTGTLNMGFQSIFKSLYCSNTVANDPRPSVDTELGTKISDIDATPIAYHRESGMSSKQFMPSNEELNESISNTEPAKLKVLPVNSDSIQKGCKTSSAANENTHTLLLDKENEGLNSKSSQGKHKTNNSVENNDSDLPSEGKTTHILSNRSDAMGSLWITRFSTKSSGLLPQVSHYNHSVVCKKLDSHPHDNDPLEARNKSTEEPLTSAERELQNAEVSSGPKRISEHNDDSLCKLDSNLPSQRLKSSDAIASVFARRLDAIKHIIPSGITDDAAARAATTCFFCGIKGHHLRECSEIAEIDLEDLLRNINLHGGAEESSCLCIRCFQLNHWAVSCPNPSRQMECDVSLSMRDGTSKLQHFGGNKWASESGKVLESSLKHKLNEMVTSDKMISGTTVVNRAIASSSVKNESRREPMGPLSTLNKQMPENLTEIFDAIKRLRLSRTEILKWMNSHISLSHLNGLFLRLRLGKWEEGLGGTGYYVACIAGSDLEPNSRNAIPVNVGSVKCFVESQYISNHDFSEDELMAWWSAAVRNGSEIPCLQGLWAKVEDKKMLGF